MGRKFFAVIEMDEDFAARNTEINGLKDKTHGEYLESEFGWLNQSGLSLIEWMIADEDDELRWARYVNYLIDWGFRHHSENFEGMSPACYDEWCDNEDTERTTYTWKDIVCINGVCYAEEFPISGERDNSDDIYYQLDDFYEAVAEKYGVDVDEIKTYMMDGIEFDPQVLAWGAEDCGCYIDGVAEWLIGLSKESD